MKKIILVLVLLALAWVAGWWPERGNRQAVEAERQRLAQELEASQERVRVAAILGRVLSLRDSVAAQNYGIAREASSQLFDAVRLEAGQASATFKPVLESIQQMRDTVTVALSRADPAVAEVVRGMEVRLRTALGYPVGAEPAPATPLPVPSPSPDAAPPSPSPAG